MSSNPIHITHIIPSLLFGGAERTVVDIINNSDPKRFRFSVIIFFDLMPLALDIKRHDVEIILVPKKGRLSLGLISALEEKLRLLKPDVVHTHLFGGDVWGRLAAKRLGLPVISTEHNINQSEGWFKKLVKSILKHTGNQYVAVSTAIKNDMVERYGIDVKKIDVIHCGVNTTLLGNVSSSSFKVPFRLLILGRLTMQKGPHVALLALSKLLDYSWKLDIVGEGELEQPLKVLVKQLGLKNRVSFYGPTRNISHLFAAHDIVLMPSLWEGLGMVAMEAMAAGRMVVASNVGGLPEIITDNETGFLVSPNDPKLFAEKLRWCFNNAEQCRVVAEGERAYAAEHFKAEVMAAGYAVHYEALRRK